MSALAMVSDRSSSWAAAWALTWAPRARRVLPLAFGAALVVGTIALVGTGPLVRGLLAVSPAAALGACLLTAVATAAAAWRWRTVSAELGLSIRWSAAVAAYYRSQFVNTVLPGGVLGDVHRAYRHGRHSRDLPIAARAVATERIAGQAVQLILTVAVLAALGLASPRARWLPSVAWIAAGAAGAILVALLATLLIAVVSARGRRMLRRELSLLATVFRRARASASVAAASVVVVAAHAGTFVVACLAVGIHASPPALAGLALIALAAASLPINVGGWGPREAASAAAFGVIGLGAEGGLAASTTFGILTFVAVLPGAVVLIAARTRAARTVHPLPEERTA